LFAALLPGLLLWPAAASLKASQFTKEAKPPIPPILPPPNAVSEDAAASNGFLLINEEKPPLLAAPKLLPLLSAATIAKGFVLVKEMTPLGSEVASTAEAKGFLFTKEAKPPSSPLATASAGLVAAVVVSIAVSVEVWVVGTETVSWTACESTLHRFTLLSSSEMATAPPSVGKATS